MRIEFPYFRLSFNDKYRPYIPISIRYRGRSANTIGLLDSGADFSIIPIHLAKRVGIRLSKRRMRNISSVGKEMNVYMARTTIAFLFEEDQELAIPHVRILVPTNPKYNNTILGRDSIFKEFLITFVESNKKVIFDRIDYY